MYVNKYSTYRTVTAVLLLFLAAAILRAQDGIRPPDSTPPPSVVSGFAVFGNELTREEVILRELTIAVGDTINPEALEYNKSRIYSLGLFTRVELTYPPMDSTVLIIEVEERWYLYPVPIVGIVDRDWSKWYFGLGVKHDNFRGRNEKVFGGFALGYNPWVSASYSNPWILGDQQLFTETSASYSDVVNRSLDAQGEGPNFHEKHVTALQTFGKRLDPFHSLWFSVGFSYVGVSSYAPGRTLSDRGRDRYFSIALGARHDTRDLREYPTEGIYGAAVISKSGLGLGDVDFFHYSVDLRGYFRMPENMTLGLRSFTLLTSGPAVPNYEHVYFGYSERLRGHFYKVYEGENIFGLLTELRIPIIPRLYVTIPQIPIRQFATWRLGLYATVFFDAGTIWNRLGHPGWEHMRSGYGGGLNFLLPYSVVIRLDRAWNEYGRGEWIFDLGVSF